MKFPLPTFLHLEDRESRRDEAQVELVINPPAINFPANKFVSNWQPIAEMFRYLHMTAQHRDTVSDLPNCGYFTPSSESAV